MTRFHCLCVATSGLAVCATAAVAQQPLPAPTEVMPSESYIGPGGPATPPGLLPNVPQPRGVYRPYSPHLGYDGVGPHRSRTPDVFSADEERVEDRLPPASATKPPPIILLPEGPPLIDDYSWILIEKPRPRPIRVHDIITVTVDDKNEVFVDNRFNRSRIGQMKAELKEFIRLGDNGNLLNAAANAPTVDANIQSRLNSQGQIQAQEGIKSIVAATVVDIQPNGNLVLEARKEASTNNDSWEYRLTGVIRPEKISRDFTALSEDLAELKIEKIQKGKVRHSTKRPWGVKLYDWLSPF